MAYHTEIYSGVGVVLEANFDNRPLIERLCDAVCARTSPVCIRCYYHRSDFDCTDEMCRFYGYSENARVGDSPIYEFVACKTPNEVLSSRLCGVDVLFVAPTTASHVSNLHARNRPAVICDTRAMWMGDVCAGSIRPEDALSASRIASSFAEAERRFIELGVPPAALSVCSILEQSD